MVEEFHNQLEQIKNDVIRMGDLAKELLYKATDALKKQDVDLANWVISKKKEIATMDEKIEGDALRLISLYQPMAKDMRTIACTLKMITYLARIGRYGKDIANVAKELADKPHIAKLVEIPHMAEMVRQMIHDALESFQSEDLSVLHDFAERDDAVDALRYSVFRECITYMMEDPRNITRCMHYAMIARYLERCADHACKIAEKIHYMVTGEHIEIR